MDCNMNSVRGGHFPQAWPAGKQLVLQLLGRAVDEELPCGWHIARRLARFDDGSACTNSLLRLQALPWEQHVL